MESGPDSGDEAAKTYALSRRVVHGLPSLGVAAGKWATLFAQQRSMAAKCVVPYRKSIYQPTASRRVTICWLFTLPHPMPGAPCSPQPADYLLTLNGSTCPIDALS